jgi:hypothetical protein
MKPHCIPSTLTVLALASMSVHAAVNYIDYTSPGTWAVDPAYSSAPTNPSAPSTDYTVIAAKKSQGVPITSYGAKAGGGIDVFFTYGGFQVQTTTRTEQYKAFAYNFQATGNQEAFWGAKVGGGVDYLYYDSFGAGDVLKYNLASNLTGTYNALAPANAGSQILSSYGARAGGGIDFLYYDSVGGTAASVDTGLNSSTVYQALSLNTATGNASAFWGARAGGGVDYMYYTGASWVNLPLTDHLDGRNYLGLVGADGSALDVGTYAARADGGIDLISIAADGLGGWEAVVNESQLLGSGTVYNSFSMDRSGLVPGDFFANAVPEPSTYGLLALGGLGALAAIRRRRNQA